MVFAQHQRHGTLKIEQFFFFLSYGYKNSQSDELLSILFKGQFITLMLIYAVDIIVIGNNKGVI